MIGFLLDFAPERMPALFPVLLREPAGLNNNASVAGLILRKGGKRFENEVHAFFHSMKEYLAPLPPRSGILRIRCRQISARGTGGGSGVAGWSSGLQ